MRSTFRKLNAGNRKMRGYPPTTQVINLRDRVSQMIDELILASTLHNALRREKQAADTTERKNLLEKYTKDLKALHEELVQAIASGNVSATKAAQTAVDNTQQQAAECVGLDRERWSTQLHDIGTEEVRRGYLHYKSVAHDAACPCRSTKWFVNEC